MDITLQGEMDGIAASEHIRQRIDVPIIFLTAHTDDATLNRAKTSGPFAYLIKPFQERELDIAIQMAIFKHEAEKRLRDSEERLRLLIESSEDIVLIQDLNGVFTYYHGSSTFGLTEADLLGKTPADIFGAEMAATWHKNLASVIETRQKMTYETSLEWHGSTLWLNAHLYPLEDPTGQLRGVATVARDITETKRLKGILPLCAWCGTKAKDENGNWVKLDIYLTTHTDAQVSHGICDDCAREMSVPNARTQE